MFLTKNISWTTGQMLMKLVIMMYIYNYQPLGVNLIHDGHHSIKKYKNVKFTFQEKILIISLQLIKFGIQFNTKRKSQQKELKEHKKATQLMLQVLCKPDPSVSQVGTSPSHPL